MSSHARVTSKLASLASSSTPHSGLLQRQCACGGSSGLAERCEECSGKQSRLQRRATKQGSPSAAPPVVHEALRSAGQPLNAQTRNFMEPRFGHDFSHVRVHTGHRAEESARAVNALAYTVGHDISFAAGQYAPGTATGQRLLAHELAHVVQQQQGALKNFFRTPRLGHDPESARRLNLSNDVYEREADQMADAVMKGKNVRGQANGAPESLPPAPAPETSVPVDESTKGANDAACAEKNKAEKMTACIQPIVIADDDGKNPTTAPSLNKTQEIWKKCCIEYSIKGTQTINKAAFKTLDQDPNAITAEEKEMYKEAGTSSCIQVFVPVNFKIGAETGKNLLGGGVTLHGGLANPKVCVVEGAAAEVLAHEIGHASGHAAHDTKKTVMKPTSAHNVPNSSKVSDDVCKGARTGAVLTKGGSKDCCMDPK